MKQLAPVAVGVAVLLVCGLVHGLWTDRWRPAAEPRAWAERLQNVPSTLGDWEGQDVPLEPKKLQIAETAGSLARNYVNRRTGARVALVLVCGRPGPVAVHAPDVCYPGSGYELVESPVRYTVPSRVNNGPSDQFWLARFRKPSAVAPVSLRIFWAWDATGTWEAPTNPRLEFGRYPALSKLYLIRQMDTADDSLEKDPCLEFLPLLLTELRRLLAPGAEQVPTGA
jgi:hypothetical protein